MSDRFILTVVCCPVPNFFVIFTSLILVEEYMLHDVAEFPIPKPGHSGINLYCHGQIKVIISGMGKNVFALGHDTFIFYMYIYTTTLWSGV